MQKNPNNGEISEKNIECGKRTIPVSLDCNVIVPTRCNGMNGITCAENRGAQLYT